MINRILNDIEDETCYYVGTNGCLYQDLEKEELYAIKNEIDKYKEVIDIITIIVIIILFALSLIWLNDNAKRVNRETAKMSIDWTTNTCSLYWE